MNNKQNNLCRTTVLLSFQIKKETRITYDLLINFTYYSLILIKNLISTHKNIKISFETMKTILNIYIFD